MKYVNNVEYVAWYVYDSFGMVKSTGEEEPDILENRLKVISLVSEDGKTLKLREDYALYEFYVEYHSDNGFIESDIFILSKAFARMACEFLDHQEMSGNFED